MKPCNCFKWGREVVAGCRGWGGGGDSLTNVQCQAVWNCHNERGGKTRKQEGDYLRMGKGPMGGERGLINRNKVPYV